jgi:hypothetical protein
MGFLFWRLTEGLGLPSTLRVIDIFLVVVYCNTGGEL